MPIFLTYSLFFERYPCI